MAKDRNVYLIGPMGSGKSAVGRLLARRLRRPFVDTDLLIVRRAGASVPEIFARRGERRFRALERRVVRGVARRSGRIVALGGGAPAQPELAKLLARTGVIVRLTCEQRALWRRLAPEASGRPLLAARSAAQSRRRLAKLLRGRARSFPAGDIRVSTSRASAAEAARRIALALAAREERA